MASALIDFSFLGTKAQWESFIRSPEFDFFLFLTIVAQCYTLADVDPTASEDAVGTYIANYIYDLIFLFEFVVKIIVLGRIKYFLNRWHTVDAVVSTVGFIELLFALILYCDATLNSSTNSNLSVLSDDTVRFLKVIRLVRLLKTLKSLALIPSITVFIKSAFACVEKILVIVMLLLGVLILLAFIAYERVGSRLQFRCLPDSTSSFYSDVTSGEYYSQYGMDFYNSKYNMDTCGNEKYPCADGYYCGDISDNLLTYQGAGADMSSPFRAFITNLAFLTQRGWPNIFWTLATSSSVSTASLLFFLMFILGTLVVVNLLPAVFVVTLKQSKERIKKLNWLMLYPGDLATLSEIELFMWARHYAAITEYTLVNEHREDRSVVGRVFALLSKYFPVWTAAYKKRQSDLKEELKATVSVRIEENDFTHTSNPVDEVRFESIDEEEFVEDYETEEMKRKYCIPFGKTCGRWRSIINNEAGIFQLFMYIVTLFQIILQSMESDSQTTVIKESIYYGNICVMSLYFLEITLKILTLGPCLYFSIRVNQFDFILTLAGVPTLVNGNETFASASTLRILRILRIFKLLSFHYALYRSQNKTKDGIDRKKSDYSIHIVQVLNIFKKLIPEIINVTVLMLAFSFIMAILGMEVLGSYGEIGDLVSLNYTYNSSLVAPIYGIENLWNAGKYRDRMNFGSFGRAYITVFNILNLNGWHTLALEYIRRAGSFVILYFIIAIFLMNYFLAATLMASSSEIMETEGRDVLQKMAAHNGNLIYGLQRCRHMFLKRHYFAVYRAAIAEDITNKQSGGAPTQSGIASRANELDAYEPPENTFSISNFLAERKLYSLWIFKPNSIVRSVINHFLKSAFYELIAATAIGIVVAHIISNGTSNYEETSWVYLQYATTAVFLLEMLLKWLAYGVYGTRESYFHIFNFMNYADFLTNIVLILSYFFPTNSTVLQINQIRVIRVIRIPVLLQLLSNSESLVILVASIRQSAKSLFTLLTASMIINYFFSVLLLQVWVGTLGECSSDQYPAGQGMSTSSTTFPNGCSGTTLVKSSIDDTYNYERLSWTWFTDNANNIFSTNRLLFRMIVNNEYQGIMYTSMDVTESYTQPSIYSNRGTFIMFIFSHSISMTISVVTASIVGYHYFINSAMKGKNLVFGSDESFFASYEDKLSSVTAGNDQSQNTKGKTRFIYNMENNILYRLLFGCIAFAPTLVLLCYFQETYGTSPFIFYDIMVSLFYVADFLFRFCMATDKFYYATSSQGEQEIAINLFLVFTIVYVIFMSDVFTNVTTLQYRLIYASVVLRMHRLNAVCPDIVGLIVVLKYSLSGFAPLLAYIASLVLIFGVFATAVFGGYNPSYETDWQNSYYNFSTYIKSWFLLFAIGTGNMYTEVLDAYRPSMGTEMTGLLEAFLATFILLYTVIVKSFAIMIISKYVKHYGGTIGIATQQVQQIQRLWSIYSEGNGRSINFENFLKLLAALPAPLGKSNIQNYVNLLRFAKKILLSMPSSGKGGKKDATNTFGLSRNLYEYESLPLDLRDLQREEVNGMPGTDTMKFTFTQVLVAVHKNFMMPFELFDEVSHVQKRQVPLQRVNDMRTSIILNLAERTIDGGPPSNVTRATRAMLLIQRLDPKQYFSSYINLMSLQVQKLQKRIEVFGLSGIDSYVLSNLRKAILMEKQAIFNRFKFYKFYFVSTSRKVTTEYKFLDKYYSNVRSLDQRIGQLYSLNIDQEWKLESIAQVKSFQSKENVTAIAIDNTCSVYAAFGETGTLKIWKNVSVNTATVTSSSKFKVSQKLNLGAPIKALQLRADAKVMVVGCGNEIIIFATASGGQRGKKSAVRGFVEQSRVSDHTGAVTSLAFFNKYLFSSSLDGLTNLWNFKSLEPLNSYNNGSSVFCMHICETKQENMPTDQMIISHSLVVGTKSGKIVLLPVPFTSSSETKPWGAVSYNTSNVPVSSIQSAWGLLYVGVADGTVKTYAIEVAGKEESEAFKNNPIGVVSLKFLATSAVHTGPITSLCYTGGALFSASHDFSIVPWLKPENATFKTKSIFSQTQAGGMIFHSSPIICAASNKMALVTADENGQIIIAAPSSTEDVLQFGASEFLQLNVKFSFLEYDFGSCLVEHHNIKSEEIAYLRITNTSNKTITVRCLLKTYVDSVFTCTADKNLALAEGIAMERVPGEESDVATLTAQQTITYSVVFSPLIDKVYSIPLEFLINDTHIAKLSIKGQGDKPKLSIANHTKIYDFEVVAVGSHKYIYIHVSNETMLPIVAHFPECKDDKKKNGVETVINIFPKVLLIGPKKVAKVALKYSPREKTQSFQIPLKINYCGWTFTLTTLRGRADEAHNITELSTSPSAKTMITNIPAVVHTSYLERNLRPLKANECILPGNLVSTMLFSKGWLVSVANNLAVLIHTKTGQFLEIPRSVTGADQAMGKSCLQIRYQCPFDTYCEVECGKNVIAKSDGSSVKSTIIKIEPHEILADDHIHAEDDSSIKFSIGYHTLFVKVYLRSMSSSGKLKPSDLLYTTAIKIMKGLRVSRVREDDIIEFEDRLNVIGIEKTTQNILDAPGCSLDEVFSVDVCRTGISASLFPLTSISLSPVNDPTHMSISDIITGESLGKKTRINLETTITEKFNSLTGTESVILSVPKLRSAVSDSNLLRSLKVKYYRKDISASLVPLSQTTPVKEMSMHCHVAAGLIERAKKANLATNKLLSHNIYSQTHSIGVNVHIANGDDLDATGNAFYNTVYSTEQMIDTMLVREGSKEENNEISAIFGQWFFVLSDGEVRLISADFDRSDYQSTEILFNSNGFHATLESSTTINTSDTVIQFVEDGAKDVINLNKDKIMSFANKNDKKFNIETNLSMPMFINDIWELLLTDNFINSVKAHMKYCAVKQALIDRGKSNADASSPENTKITYKDVYAELLRLTTIVGTADANTKEKLILNIKKLVTYFQTVPIRGNDEPLSFSQIDVALRELVKSSSGLITIDAFKKWYLDKSAKSKINEVNERTYFALLLDESLQLNKRGGGDEEYEEYEEYEKQRNNAKSNKKHERKGEGGLSIASMIRTSVNVVKNNLNELTHHSDSVDEDSSNRKRSLRPSMTFSPSKVINTIRNNKFFKKGSKKHTERNSGDVELVNSTELDDVDVKIPAGSLANDERKSANESVDGDDDNDDDDEDEGSGDDSDYDYDDDDDSDDNYDDESSEGDKNFGSESSSESGNDDDDESNAEQSESSVQIRKTMIK